jgi:hypothetical protein
MSWYKKSIRASDLRKISAFYHATYICYIDDILEQGLRPGMRKNWGQSSPNHIYLSTNTGQARSWARGGFDAPSGYEFSVVILEINPAEPDFNWDLLDFDQGSNGSDILRDTFEYRGTIPPTILQVVEWPDDSLRYPPNADTQE